MTGVWGGVRELTTYQWKIGPSTCGAHHELTVYLVRHLLLLFSW